MQIQKTEIQHPKSAIYFDIENKMLKEISDIQHPIFDI
jgi:hypothetical protein